MSEVNSAEYWDAAYREGRDGWSLGTPTPVFERLVQKGRSTDSGEELSLVPGRVLIPCSGHGHDAMLFARNGFLVTAVDMASASNVVLKEMSDAEGLGIRIIEEDMFLLDARHDGMYDYLVEYTCLCAIDPLRREDFFRLITRLIKPGGLFISLLFPVDGRPGGPPFAIDRGDFVRMMQAAFRPILTCVPEDSIPPRRGRESLEIWKRES